MHIYCVLNNNQFEFEFENNSQLWKPEAIVDYKSSPTADQRKKLETINLIVIKSLNVTVVIFMI